MGRQTKLICSPVKSKITQNSNCPQCKRKENLFDFDLLPEIINLDGDPRPFLKVIVLGMECDGLLDSGSSCTILGKDGLDIVKMLKLSGIPSNLAIKTADVHRALCRVDIPYRVKNRVHVVPTLVIPSMAKHLILGIDFWNKFGIKPHFTQSSELSCNAIMNDSPEISAEMNKIEKKMGEINEREVNKNNERVELSDEQKTVLTDVISQFYTTKDGELGCTNILKHKIDTGNAAPVVKRPYPVSPFIQKEVDVELNRMLSLGVIEPAEGEWANPMVIVRKPTGKIRMCLDARGLNLVTVKDRYPLPHIGRILSQIQATKYQSSIDLSDAFWQVPLEVESKVKTAFIVPGRGHFQFTRVPFGLCNSAQTLCKAIDKCIGYDLEPSVFGYIDDIIITADTFERHIELLREVSKRLKGAGFSISAEKSRFCVKELRYLGYVMDEHGLSTDPEKIAPILNIPPPKSLKEVRSLMGMASWYKRFIKNYSDLVAPMSNLTKKENSKKFVWTSEADEALIKLKSVLVSAPILRSPNFEQPFSIQTDASDVGIGAVLTQGEGEDERVIAYMSRKLTAAQKKYTTTERECLAVLEAISHFKSYVEGTRFKVVTDHASLLWLRNLKDPSSRLTRWALRMQAYDFELVHRRGKLNVVADALSRFVESIEVEETVDNLDEDYLKLRENIGKNPGKFSNFCVQNGIIYKHCVCRNDSGLIETEWKVYVAASDRSKILNEVHDDALGSHFGVLKTYQRVKTLYYWPKMKTYVKNYVASCEKCQLNKHSNNKIKVPMGEQKKIDGLWDSISIDFVGPFPRSKKGNKYLLVIIDNFSKYCILRPTRNADAKTVVNILENEVFLVYGVPSIIIADNGSQFISKAFKDLMKSYNVRINYNAAYHAQHNPAERPNRGIVASMRSYIENDQREWDVVVPKIACAIQTSPHESSGYSPYVINFGKLMNLKGSGGIGNPNVNVSNEERLERLLKIREDVKKNLNDAYQKYSKYYNLRTKMVSFEPGEIVRRKSFFQSSAPNNFNAKLANQYVKCRVREKLGSATYLLEDMQGKVLGKYHANDLLKFVERE